MTSRFDPLTVEVIRNEFGAVTEEMAIAVARTGRSMQVKIGDCATALADAQGRCIAEGASPFQIASLMAVLERALKKFRVFQPGDVIMVNDPYAGMSHMPDCGIIAPVFWRGQLVAFTPTYSHHTDMGGRFPGSFTSAGTTSFEEGLRIPLVKLYEGGRRNEALVDIISANVRNPDDWFGDVEAKIAGCRKGATQIGLLLDRYGLEVYNATCDYLQEHAERSTKAALSAIPPGEYSAEDVFEDDGLGTEDVKLPIKLTLRAKGDNLTIDLTGSAPQAKGGVNVPFGMSTGFIYGALRAIVGPDVILNPGFTRAFDIIMPEGSIFNPRFPAAVAGRAPLAFRLADLMFRCLAQALPEKVGIPGEGGDLIHFSGRTPDGRYETFMDVFTGGWGGRPDKDGIDAVAPLSFRGGSTPVELLEREHPVVVEAFGMLPDSEGAGKYRGSLSTFRQWRFLSPGKVLIRSDHLTRPSYGLAGGGAGGLSSNILQSNGTETMLPPMAHLTIDVKPGDRIRHVIAGTGGYGSPQKRDPERVLDDVVAGKVSIARASELYGVVIDTAHMKVDVARTSALRDSMASSASPTDRVRVKQHA